MCYDFSALTLDDERKMISNLISGFVRNISFGRDFEQQLSFYVECRASFSNLDQVLVQLIQVRIGLYLKKKTLFYACHLFWYEFLCFVFFSSVSLCALFQNVNNLSMETRRVVKGNHSRKTGNFVRVKIFDRKIYVENIWNDAYENTFGCSLSCSEFF